MTRSLLLIATFLICICSCAQTNIHEFNFGFEKVSSRGELPDKWFQWGTGYNLKIDTVTKHNGRNSILIAPIGQKAPNSFGCVAYSIPSKYEGREIVLRAYMKLDNVSDGAIGLMIRVDGNSGILGFENMQSKNIQGTKDWTQFEVKIPFPEDAKTIYIGAILSGTGRLWVDDFQLLLDGKDISEAKIKEPKVYKADADKEFDNGSKVSDIPLTKSTIDNLDVLGKVWGYLKYYHPTIAKGNNNWDYELFRVLPKIANVISEKERNSILTTWVKSLGDFETAGADNKAIGEVKINPDLSWINQNTLGPELVELLNKVRSAKRPKEHYYIGQVGGVGNPEFKNERPYASMNYPDPGFRLLSLYRYWNIIAYYFPYKNLIEEDWNLVLKEFIPKFVNAGSELEYKLNLLALIARIHDTHANIWGGDKALNEFRGQRYAALEVKFVEDKAVVTNYFDNANGEKTGLKIGDVIESINNKTIEEIVTNQLHITPASNYPTQLRDIAWSLLRTNDKSLNITYSDGKKSVSTQVETFSPNEINLYAKYQNPDTCFKVINSDIGYIYPGSIRNAYVPKIMEEVSKTKGLIIDFRCYPSEFVVFSLGEYLLPEPTAFVKFSNGSIESPGLFTMTEDLKVGRSNADYYKGKVVIIVNETTQSSAEYHTMALRTAPGATVIGSTTAGADGNVSQFTLPGGIRTMISGIGVYYPDGTETQRIGIVPDIEVRPTIQGIREKRDEPLEMAIKIITGG